MTPDGEAFAAGVAAITWLMTIQVAADHAIGVGSGLWALGNRSTVLALLMMVFSHAVSVIVVLTQP